MFLLRSVCTSMSLPSSKESPFLRQKKRTTDDAAVWFGEKRQARQTAVVTNDMVLGFVPLVLYCAAPERDPLSQGLAPPKNTCIVVGAGANPAVGVCELVANTL